MKTINTLPAFCIIMFCWLSAYAQSGQSITFNGAAWHSGDDVDVSCGSNYFYVSAAYNRAGGGSASMTISPSDVTAPSGYSWISYNGSAYILAVTTSSTPQEGDFVVTARDGAYSYTFTIHCKSAPKIQIAGGGNGPTLYANQSGTVAGYSNQSIQPYSYVTWYASNGLLVQGSSSYVMSNSGDNYSVSVSTTGYGGMLYAVATNGCGSTTSPQVLSLGPAYITSTTFNGSPGSSGTVSWVATLALITNGSATGANWAITNGSGSISASGTSCNAYPSNFLRVVGTAYNDLGTGQDWTFYIWKDGYYGYRMAYPNPAKDQVTLEFDDKIIAKELLNELSLLDEKGKVWNNFSLKTAKETSYFDNSNSITFNVKDLPRGTYYLHVKIGERLNRERVVIE